MPGTTTTTLNRWLDRNPQHPLTRTRYYLSIPPIVNFPIAAPPSDSAERVIGYKFSSTARFGLRFDISPFQWMVNDTQLAWTVAMRTGTVFPDPSSYPIITRYKLNPVPILWDVYTSKEYKLPLYSGQPLMFNFMLEGWVNALPRFTTYSAPGGTLYTTALTDWDYRQGTDLPLGGVGVVITNFGNTSNTPPQPPGSFNLPMAFDKDRKSVV